jgi:Skp family chaperone for outer membrane proteins
MLNRVRDFRYEDIKNWKPLVSLRDSYRNESGIRGLILVAVCILSVLVGYSVINGNLRFANRDAAAGDSAGVSGIGTKSQTAQTHHASQLPKSGAIADPPSRMANFGADSQEIRPLPSAQNRVNHRPANFVETGRQDEGFATPATTSGKITGRSLRIAVCDVQLVLSQEIAAYTNELVQTSERQLFAEQEAVRQSVAQLTDVELVILQKLFEQKKELAIHEIRERVRQYRELADRELQAIADRIAEEQDYDLVVTTDHMLSFTQSSDITRSVKLLWDQRRQSQAQLGQAAPIRGR